MIRRPPLLAAVLLLCFLICPATRGRAGQLEDGKAAFDRQDYMAAMDLWMPLAEQGNAEAQYYVAGLYDKGLGVPIHTALGEGPFKTELIAAGGLTVLLALAADGLLVLAQRALTPWARAKGG